MEHSKRLSSLSVCLLVLGLTLAVPEQGIAEDLQSKHPALEQTLVDHSLVDGFKARLSSSWQILGMDALPNYTQGNLVGRAIAAAAKACGLSMVWDDSRQAQHAVWPVVLTDINVMSIKAYLDGTWTAAHMEPPKYLQSAAEELAKRVSSWGIGFLTVSVERPDGLQQLDYVFLDRHRITSDNDLAVFDYAITSALVGLPGEQGSPIDSDYSFLAGGQQQLELLSGTNETRLTRICRAMAVTADICGSDTASTPASVPRLLATADAKCQPNGEIVTGLGRIEAQIALTAMPK